MGFFTWVFYIITGCFLFFIIRYLENNFFITKTQNIIFSLIYMMFIGGILSRYGFDVVNDNLFLMFVFTLIFSVIYTNYFLGRDFFDKNNKLLKFYILLIVCGYILNQEFINRVEMVFLSGDDLKIILWFLSFLFIYQFIKERDIIKNSNENFSKFDMSDESIVINYAKLKYKYNDKFKCSDKVLKILYSIMIYENNKRPSFLRKFDNFMFKLDGCSRKLGIMQVESKKFISDIESIEIVNKKLDKMINDKKISDKDIINKYCKEDSEFVNKIYDCICKI